MTRLQRTARVTAPGLSVRCALCRRWLSAADRLPTTAGPCHFRCVAAVQATLVSR